MNFEIKISAAIDHVSGKFAPKDEIEEQLVEALEAADYGSWSTSEGEYETTEFDVEVKS